MHDYGKVHRPWRVYCKIGRSYKTFRQKTLSRPSELPRLQLYDRAVFSSVKTWCSCAPFVPPSCVCFWCHGAKRPRTLAEGRPPDPLPCQNSLSHDKSLLGGWVADVVLGNPVGEVLRGFMEQEVSSTNPRRARAIKRELSGEQVSSIPRDPAARHEEPRRSTMASTRRALLGVVRESRGIVISDAGMHEIVILPCHTTPYYW